MPEKGVKLYPAIVVKDWNIGGIESGYRDYSAECGAFVLDDLSFAGAPDSLTMGGLGFVEKKASEADGRFVYIRSTQAGRDLVGKYVDEYFTGLGESLTDITDEDADIMIATIEKIYDVMSKRSQDIR